MNIILSGGRGFIGSHLVPELLRAGHAVRIWSRTGEGSTDGVRSFRWDPVGGPPPPESLAGIDAIVHLAGENVGHRWSDELKRKIHDSRVLGTRNLVEGIRRMPQPPAALISSSATGYYGDRGEEELVEFSAAGKGFLADVCQEWEREADAVSPGTRLLKIRTGMVLGAGGGALAKLIPTFKSKMGGKLGSGKQWIPWIHMADVVGLYRAALEQPVSGVWNGTAPHPVRNEAFTEALGKALGQPAKLSVPEFALKMMFGEMADVLLGSQKVFPRGPEAAGYQFQFPLLDPALDDNVKGTAH